MNVNKKERKMNGRKTRRKWRAFLKDLCWSILHIGVEVENLKMDTYKNNFQGQWGIW